MSHTETTFTIQGMSCGGCVNSVTRVLKAVPGVEPLHVNVGSATVRIDAEVGSAALAKAAIERAGFSVVAQV